MTLPGAYWRSLVGVVPTMDLARAAVLRLVSPRPLTTPRRSSALEAERAAQALAQRPRLFAVAATEDLRALYDEALPGRAAVAIDRARAILDGRVTLFGREHRLALDEWHLDYRSGRRFDGSLPSSRIDMLAAGADPRLPWERARAAHLVALGVAAHLEPSLRAACARSVHAEITSFLDGNPPGQGLHWTSPIEVALRVVHWLAALELVDDRADAGDALHARLGGALLEHGRFLVENLEDRGAVPANHLIADWLGVLAIGVATGVRPWQLAASEALSREAARQVHSDGAAFEGSTGYHRFTLELLLAADRLARAAHLPLDLGDTLAGMFRFVAATVGPDGQDPGIGDADDGRVLALAERPPRERGYLLAVGVVRTGDPTLRRATSAGGTPFSALSFSEEAAWLEGNAGWRRFAPLAPLPRRRCASFTDGGVHVLSGGPDDRDQVVLRCGGHGQRGVGGHSHCDQLSVTVWADGAPLVVDPGTLLYTADPAWRDHLRGTASHATLTVEGEEQSPLPESRPFALPDAARGELVCTVDDGNVARLVGRHHGYRRLPCRAVHTREVLLDRGRRTLVLRDRVDGAGRAAIALHLPLGEAEARPLDDATRDQALARIAGASWLTGEPRETLGEALGLWHGRRLCAALLSTLPAIPERGWWSPRYGERRAQTVLRFGHAGALAFAHAMALVICPGVPRRGQ